jgi:hypothetical protein
VEFLVGVFGVRDFDEAIASSNVRDVPSQLFVNPSEQELISLHERAGVFLHMATKPIGVQKAVCTEFPIGIAEAMATGSHILAPISCPSATYINNAGSLYRDIDQAVLAAQRNGRLGPLPG